MYIDAIGIEIVAVSTRVLQAFYRLIETPRFQDYLVKAKSKVRKWDDSIGLDPSVLPDTFVERCVKGCAQQFNFWQDINNSIASEHIWKWVRHEINIMDMMANLVDIRTEVHINTVELLAKHYRLTQAIMTKSFWVDLNKAFNPVVDPCYKKAILLKMMLEDSGFKVYNSSKWGYGCVDYNALVTLNEYNIIDCPGKIWDKNELDKIRKEVYALCYHAVNDLNIDASALDGVLFFAGREIRKAKGNGVIPKVLNETAY